MRESCLFFFFKGTYRLCLFVPARQPGPYLALYTLVCNFVLRKNSPEFKRIYGIWRGAPLPRWASQGCRDDETVCRYPRPCPHLTSPPHSSPVANVVTGGLSRGAEPQRVTEPAAPCANHNPGPTKKKRPKCQIQKNCSMRLNRIQPQKRTSVIYSIYSWGKTPTVLQYTSWATKCQFSWEIFIEGVKTRKKTTTQSQPQGGLPHTNVDSSWFARPVSHINDRCSRQWLAHLTAITMWVRFPS